MKQTWSKISPQLPELLLATGIAVFVFLTSLMILPAILFWLGLGVGSYQVWASVSLTAAIVMAWKRSWSKVSAILLCAAIISSGSIWFSGLTIDTSFDGNGYRKVSTGILAEGWNPVHQDPQTFNRQNYTVNEELAYFGGESNWFFIDAYPKGPAFLSANIYATTGNIETGKAYTLMLMAVLACFISAYLLARGLPSWQAGLVALVVALNPVSLTQFTTFYTDAALTNILLILLLMLVVFFDSDWRVSRRLVFSIISLCILWATSIKFNGLFFAGLFCIIFFVYFAVTRRRRLYEGFTATGVFTVFALAGLLSILLNATPYLTNYARYGILLVGIDSRTPAATGNFTASTQGFSVFQNFLSVIFGRMGDFWTDPHLPLKRPFTIAAGEIDNYAITAPQFGTFGMFFSGLLLVALLILGIYLWRQRRQLLRNELLRVAVLFVIVSTVQCALTPVAIGGLRYVGHFYLLLPLAVLTVCFWWNQAQLRSLKVFWSGFLGIFILLVALNIAPWLRVTRFKVADTQLARQKLAELSIHSQGRSVAIALENVAFQGLKYNLKDAGLQVHEVPRSSILGPVTSVINSNVVYATPDL